MIKREYDVIIVGSGAGGGTVASRLIPLAEKGAKIAVLEAGPHYSNDYFTQRELEMMDLFWFGGAWPLEDGSITLAAGKAVGGSTLMYTGVTFRLPDAVCDEWGISDITPADLAPRFDRLEAEISVAEPGDEMVNDNNRLFKKGCEKLGWGVEKIRLNLKDCDQSGFCNLGCRNGAKQGTMEVQLPKAMAAGIELIPNCEVARIGDGRVYANVRPAPSGTEPGPWPPGKTEIRAKRIVLSAGSPGSPGILLRSGFGEKFPALGRYFTLHPALTLCGICPQKIKSYKGFPKTYYTPEFSDSHGYFIETAFYYPFITTKHLGLWGHDLKTVMKSYDHLMTILILNHDPALWENRIAVDKKGNIRLCYKIAPETVDSLCHSQIQASKIFFAAGCEKVIMPCANPMIFSKEDISGVPLEDRISTQNFVPNKMPISSAHPQGGCRMGTDPETSVSNSRGQVHDHPWLYVADASLFPKSSHVNPYLTIMALADRVGEQILQDIDR